VTGAAPVDQRLALLEAGLVSHWGRRIGDDQPPAVFRQREERQRAIPMPPAMLLGRVAFGANPYVPQYKKFGVAGSRKGYPRLLAHHAVRPVAAEHPFSLDLFGSVGGSELSRDSGLALRQSHKLGVALNVHGSRAGARRYAVGLVKAVLQRIVLPHWTALEARLDNPDAAPVLLRG
jgi:hypothetical protein